MELMDIDNIFEMRKLIEDNAHNDDLIEKLILEGESLYIVLEKIIDGTLDKKHLKIIIPLKTKSPEEWEDFQTFLEIGVMDGELELADIAPLRSTERNRRS